MEVEQEEEVVVDEAILGEEPTEPFDWEDLLYESWLEEQHRQKRKRAAEAGI